LLGVSLRELLDTLGPPAGAALLMATAVLALRHALDATPGLVELLVLVGFGGVVYTGALWLLGRERWRELVATARDVLSGGRGAAREHPIARAPPLSWRGRCRRGVPPPAPPRSHRRRRAPRRPDAPRPRAPVRQGRAPPCRRSAASRRTRGA